MATSVIPSEAGPIVFHMRKLRPLRIVLIAATVALLVGFGFADRTLVPVVGAIAGVCAVIGIVGGTVKYFVTKLWALCEHGLVTKKAAQFDFIPWSAVTGVDERVLRGSVIFTIHTRQGSLSFYPGQLGNDGTRRALAFIEQRAER